MGYYTRYELSIKENRTYKVSDIVTYMKQKYYKEDKYYPFAHEFDSLLIYDGIYNFEFDMSDEIKWYDYNEEMIELSLQFPNALFQLYGDGEENGDTWYTYYKNGKKQHCPAKITYDKYDENELK